MMDHVDNCLNRVMLADVLQGWNFSDGKILLFFCDGNGIAEVSASLFLDFVFVLFTWSILPFGFRRNFLSRCMIFFSFRS